jgi:4-hydroxy-tetrahydrodipicolinate synthase
MRPAPQSTGASSTSLPDGVYTASLTPLDEDFGVQLDLYRKHVRWLLQSGCDGIVVMGSSGEANSLPFAERQRGLDALIEAEIPASRLMVGTGRCSLAETVALTRHAVSRGVGGILLLPPFYYKNPSDEGLFVWIDQLIQRVGDEALKIYLYHIPPTSHVPFGDALIQRLLDAYPQTVVGMKDSSGDLEHMKTIRKRFPQLRLFAGTERYLLDILRLGGPGCISAAANVSCALAAQVYRAWRQQQTDVEQLQERLSAIRSALEPFPLVPALKAWTAMRTGDATWRRVCPPMVALEEGRDTSLRSALQGLLP